MTERVNVFLKFFLCFYFMRLFFLFWKPSSDNLFFSEKSIVLIGMVGFFLLLKKLVRLSAYNFIELCVLISYTMLIIYLPFDYLGIKPSPNNVTGGYTILNFQETDNESFVYEEDQEYTKIVFNENLDKGIIRKKYYNLTGNRAILNQDLSGLKVNNWEYGILKESSYSWQYAYFNNSLPLFIKKYDPHAGYLKNTFVHGTIFLLEQLFVDIISAIVIGLAGLLYFNDKLLSIRQNF